MDIISVGMLCFGTNTNQGSEPYKNEEATINCGRRCLFFHGRSRGPASAEIPVTLNAGVGYWYFDRDDMRGYEPDDTTTPSWGWSGHSPITGRQKCFTPTRIGADFKNGGPDMDIQTWQVGGLYYGGSYIGNQMRLRPYLALGGGEIKIEGDRFDTVETTVNGGGGVRWMFGERLGLRLEARAIYSVDESETDYLVSAGLNFYMGKVAADPVAVERVDSDGDGVYDDRDQCPGTPAGTRVDADGCPLAVAKVASIKLKVNFGFDSTTVAGAVLL